MHWILPHGGPAPTRWQTAGAMPCGCGSEHGSEKPPVAAPLDPHQRPEVRFDAQVTRRDLEPLLLQPVQRLPGEELASVPSFQNTWFAWSDFHPDSEVYEP
jgi:hypothetical protein